MAKAISNITQKLTDDDGPIPQFFAGCEDGGVARTKSAAKAHRLHPIEGSHTMRAMRWLSLTLLVAVSSGCATRSGIDAERLQGTWIVTAVERNGAADGDEIGSTLAF